MRERVRGMRVGTALLSCCAALAHLGVVQAMPLDDQEARFRRTAPSILRGARVQATQDTEVYRYVRQLLGCTRWP